MRTKTVAVLAITVLVALLFIKNREETNFWLFGQRSISKAVLFGGTLIFGVLLGFMARPRKQNASPLSEEDGKYIDTEDDEKNNDDDGLSDADRDYIRF